MIAQGTFFRFQQTLRMHIVEVNRNLPKAKSEVRVSLRRSAIGLSCQPEQAFFHTNQAVRGSYRS